MEHEFLLFAGTANPDLAARVAAEVGVRLGASAVQRFPDGELNVKLDQSVRGREIFVIQPTSPPVHEHLLELLAFTDACRRSGAKRVVAVVPYFGYARADKRHGRREPITASLIAQLFQTAGVHHVVTLDLHAAQIEGFFHIPVDSLTALPTLCSAVEGGFSQEFVVVSPDTGRVAMATEYAKRLGVPVVVLHKQRLSGAETEVTHVVGEVRDKACLIVDDMIATGGTIEEGVQALLAAGAKPEIQVAATHGLFVGDAGTRLEHEAIRNVFVTDSIARQETQGRSPSCLQVVSIASVLAAAIRRVLGAEPKSALL